MRSLALALVLSAGFFHNGNPSPAFLARNAPGAGGTVNSTLVNTYSTLFDGSNDFVTVGKPSDMNFNSQSASYTLAVWFKRGAAADFERHFFGKAFMSTIDVTATLGVNTSEEIQALVGGGENTHGGNIGGFVHGWHMSSLTVTGASGFLYLDGHQVGPSFAVGSDVNTQSDWLIGSSRWDDNIGTGYPWAGKLDEPTVWDTAFTANDHAELFNNGTPMNPVAHTKAAYLLHWWRMGDGDSYPTIEDQIGVADGIATNMAGASNITQTDVPVGLSVMACNAASGCTAQLVADDWDGSGATWTARAGSDNGTKRGSPTLDYTPNFAGRKSLNTAPTGACMTITGDAITASTTRTYEIIVDDWGSSVTKQLLARTDGSFVNLANWIYKSSETVLESAIYTNGAGGVWFGTAGTVYTNSANKPVAWTVTMDLSAPRLTVYYNGSQIYQDTTTSGSFGTATNLAVGLGCRWNQSSAETDNFRGKILEFVRHGVELPSGVVSSRLTTFNALKGY